MITETFTHARARELLQRYHSQLATAQLFDSRGLVDLANSWFDAATQTEKRIDIICKKLEEFANKKSGRIHDLVMLQVENIRKQLE